MTSPSRKIGSLRVFSAMVDIGGFETVSGPANLAGNGYQEMNETDKDEFPSADPITEF